MKILRVDRNEFYPEGIKYSLVFVRQREDGSFDNEFLRYDNYNREGYHKHIKGKKYRYEFKDIDTLIFDFKYDLYTLLKEEGIEIDIF